jgi:membrane protein YdbS with pleckstrin-like domain
MSIATSPTRTKFPLSTKKIFKKTLTSTLALSIFLLSLWAISFFSFRAMDTAGNVGNFISVGILTALSVLLALTYLYQRWYFNVYFYDLTSDYIVIKKGPITPSEITIPYERIQDVYVNQDLFDRILGLYDVHFSSATISSGMEAHIDGVERPAADGLRALVLKTVTERIGKRKSA